jgi:hypothetical protein
LLNATPEEPPDVRIPELEAKLKKLEDQKAYEMAIKFAMRDRDVQTEGKI